jgi:hypothetical protein
VQVQFRPEHKVAPEQIAAVLSFLTGLATSGQQLDGEPIVLSLVRQLVSEPRVVRQPRRPILATWFHKFARAEECAPARQLIHLGRATRNKFHLPGKSGGLNGSTQHSARTHHALKTKAKNARSVRSAGTLPWLGFDRVQRDRSILHTKYRLIN